MSYSFRIYNKETNEIEDKYRTVGNYTSTPKQKVIEYARAFLLNHKGYYAIVYSFDWTRGLKPIGKLDLEKQ